MKALRRRYSRKAEETPERKKERLRKALEQKANEIDSSDEEGNGSDNETKENASKENNQNQEEEFNLPLRIISKFEVPELNNKDFLSPLHQAARDNDIASLISLIESEQQNVSDLDRAHQTALHYACARKGSVDMVAYLLEKGADVDARDCSGSSPLHNVARTGDDIEVLKELLKYKPNMNVIDLRMWTPLHLATALNRIEIVQELLDAGANFTYYNEFRQTPLDIAKKRAFVEISEMILKGFEKINEHIRTSAVAKPGHDFTKIEKIPDKINLI